MAGDELKKMLCYSIPLPCIGPSCKNGTIFVLIFLTAKPLYVPESVKQQSIDLLQKMIYLKYLFSASLGVEIHLFASVAWHICTTATGFHHLGVNLNHHSSLK